jgi:hypothetical protein
MQNQFWVVMVIPLAKNKRLDFHPDCYRELTASAMAD